MERCRKLKQKQTFHRKHIWHHWFLFMLDTNYNSDCFFFRGTMHNSCSQSQGDRMVCCKQLKEIKSSPISVDPFVQQLLSLHWVDLDLQELSWGENPIFLPSCGAQSPFFHIPVGPAFFQFFGLFEESPLGERGLEWPPLNSKFFML